MSKLIVLIFLLLFTSKDILGQSEVNKKGEWIQNLSKYRDYLLKKNPNATEELKHLISKWDSLGASQNDRSQVTSSLVHLRSVYGYSNKSIKKKLIKEYPESKVSTSISDENIGVIIKNSELIQMINFEVLKSKYPFNIDGRIFEEFESYGVEQKERIGEIGCGSGTFGILLNKMVPSVELYMNELDNSKLEYIDLILVRSSDQYDTENVYLLKGGKATTKLEDFELDKIIVRNTFHHFNKKKKMLASIEKSLNATGELIIFETVRELNEDDVHLCKKAMNKDEIVEIIEANGFKLKEEKKISTSYLLKFVIGKE